MAAEIFNQGGRRVWGADRDDDGHREYELITQVKTDTPDDGPATVMTTPGLPAIGSYWLFGTDIDIWAYCWPTMSVRPYKDEEPNVFWSVKQKFSTRPRWRCQDTDVEDPLLEPPRVGGSFVRFHREAAFDRHGRMIVNSAKELYRGPEVEFDEMMPTVWVELNEPDANLPALAGAARNPVNDAPLWGVGPRCVKLDQATWTRNMYGRCNFYYTKRFEFSIAFDTHDRDLLDHGTKFLKGRWEPPGGPGAVWTPDPGANWLDPTNYVTAVDPKGNVLKTALLDGGGQPLALGATPVKNHVEKYDEFNMLLLGIPATL